MGVAEGARGLARRAVTIGVLAGVTAGVVAVTRSDHTTGDLAYTAGPRGDARSPGVSRGGLARRGSPPVDDGASSSPAADVSAPAPAAPSSAAPPATPVSLPRGGRALFPTYRLVGYSGGPGSAAFGRLGVGDLDTRIREIESLCDQYTAASAPLGRTAGASVGGQRKGLPVLELIAVVAQRTPGGDGLYRERIPSAIVDGYLAAARRHRGLLLINIQPGRSRIIDEVRAFEHWLTEPDVGLALDPEWAVQAPIVPGEFFGHVSGAELDEVAAYLADLVARRDLPEKALVVHQLAPSVVQDLVALRRHPGVAVIKSVDGIGTPDQKIGTWRELVADLPDGVHPGFKLFFSEDTASGSALMIPSEVLALTPTPDYVLYE